MTNKKFMWLLAVGLFLIFVPCLPSTVQTLDTGELVRSAFAMQVPHPPGYPLFIWLLKLSFLLNPFGTVFWKASFLNSLIAVLTCIVLFLLLRSQKYLGLAICLVLATSRLFWKYSVLPDVFILNAFFCALICFLYLDTKSEKFQIYIPALFILGLANQMTLVFLAPIIGHVFVKYIKNKKQWFSSLGSIVIATFFYYSLNFLNPQNIDSWGSITSVRDIFFHIIRSDYGTFKLVSGNEESAFLSILARFGIELLVSSSLVVLAGIILFIARLYQKNKIEVKEMCFVLALSFYIIVFFYLSNLTPVGFMSEIIDRFYIMAFILIFFWSGYQFTQINFSKKVTSIFFSIFMLLALINYLNFRNENDLSENTIVEDYAINFLNQAPQENSGKKTLLITLTDTRYFALKYVQIVLRTRPDVFVMHPKLLFISWYREKIKYSGIIIGNKNLEEDNNLTIESDLIVPNLEKFNILTNLDLKDYSKYSAVILPLGKLLQKGQNANLYEGDTRINFRSGYKDVKSSTKKYDSYRELWSEYANKFFEHGMAYFVAGHESLAKEQFEEALKIVPWYMPALSKLCEIEKDSEKLVYCKDRLSNVSTNYYPYF